MTPQPSYFTSEWVAQKCADIISTAFLVANDGREPTDTERSELAAVMEARVGQPDGTWQSLRRLLRKTIEEVENVLGETP